MHMGLRFRRTMKIAPGLRLNFNKDSVGLSIGPRGAKYTINSSGRRTASVGIPGSGLYYTESSGGGKRRSQTDAEIQEAAAQADLQSRPNFLSSSSEKAFYSFAYNYLSPNQTATYEERRAQAEAVKAEHPDIAPYIDFTMLSYIASRDAKEALTNCENLYNNATAQFFDSTIAKKYFDEFSARIQIARGIFYTGDFQSNYLSYTYSELLQALGQPEKALEVIQKVKESPFKEIAILDLYLSLKRYDDVLMETEDVENIDDLSAIQLIFRAIAFRELDQHELAIETFKFALAKRSRPESIRNYALYERACTYQVMGKKALAIKDLNKILAADYTDEGAKAKLKELQ